MVYEITGAVATGDGEEAALTAGAGSYLVELLPFPQHLEDHLHALLLRLRTLRRLQAIRNRIPVRTAERIEERLHVFVLSHRPQEFLGKRRLTLRVIGRLPSSVPLCGIDLRLPRRCHLPRCHQPFRMASIDLRPPALGPPRREPLPPRPLVMFLLQTVNPPETQRLIHGLCIGHGLDSRGFLVNAQPHPVTGAMIRLEPPTKFRSRPEAKNLVHGTRFYTDSGQRCGHQDRRHAPCFPGIIAMGGGHALATLLTDPASRHPLALRASPPSAGDPDIDFPAVERPRAEKGARSLAPFTAPIFVNLVPGQRRAARNRRDRIGSWICRTISAARRTARRYFGRSQSLRSTATDRVTTGSSCNSCAGIPL